MDLTWGETLYIPEHRNPLNLETPIQFKVDTTTWEAKTEQKHSHKPLFSLLNLQTKPAKKSAPNSSLGIVAFLTLMKQAREVKLARNKVQTCNVQEKAVLSLTTRAVHELGGRFSPGTLRWMQIANSWLSPIRVPEERIRTNCLWFSDPSKLQNTKFYCFKLLNFKIYLLHCGDWPAWIPVLTSLRDRNMFLL